MRKKKNHKKVVQAALSTVLTFGCLGNIEAAYTPVAPTGTASWLGIIPGGETDEPYNWENNEEFYDVPFDEIVAVFNGNGEYAPSLYDETDSLECNSMEFIHE